MGYFGVYLEIVCELVVDVLEAGLPAAVSLEAVAEAGCVHDGQAKFDALLLDLHGRLGDVDGFADALVHGGDFTVAVQVGEEEGVDHGGLAQAGLAHDHEGELETSFHRFSVHLKKS